MTYAITSCIAKIRANSSAIVFLSVTSRKQQMLEHCGINRGIALLQLVAFSRTVRWDLGSECQWYLLHGSFNGLFRGSLALVFSETTCAVINRLCWQFQDTWCIYPESIIVELSEDQHAVDRFKLTTYDIPVGHSTLGAIKHQVNQVDETLSYLFHTRTEAGNRVIDDVYTRNVHLG